MATVKQVVHEIERRTFDKGTPQRADLKPSGDASRWSNAELREFLTEHGVAVPAAIAAKVAAKVAARAPKPPKPEPTAEELVARKLRRQAWELRNAARSEGRKVTYKEALAKLGGTPARSK
jgi:hypothetical protein